MPRVVWAEESKNGLRFEIGPSYDNVPTTSRCLTDGQSSYSAAVGSQLGYLLSKLHYRPKSNKLSTLLNFPSLVLRGLVELASAK